MSHSHMGYYLTAEGELEDHGFDTSFRRSSILSNRTLSTDDGSNCPPTPPPSLSPTSSFGGETVSPGSLLLAQPTEFSTFAVDKPFTASMLSYNHHHHHPGYITHQDYGMMPTVQPGLIRAQSVAMESVCSSDMSPTPMVSFYHSPASSFSSDAAFEEGHDAVAIARAIATASSLRDDEEALSPITHSPFFSMISPKDSMAHAHPYSLHKKARSSDVLAAHNHTGVEKRRKKKVYPSVIPGADTKPHKCPIPDCNSRFKRQEHLKRHERTHTGEKPFVCDVSPDCKRWFSRSDNLRQHKRTHTVFNPRGRNKFVGDM